MTCLSVSQLQLVEREPPKPPFISFDFDPWKFTALVQPGSNVCAWAQGHPTCARTLFYVRSPSREFLYGRDPRTVDCPLIPLVACSQEWRMNDVVDIHELD